MKPSPHCHRLSLLSIMLALRKMSLSELADQEDITMPNLSLLKTDKTRAIRFSTLEKRKRYVKYWTANRRIYLNILNSFLNIDVIRSKPSSYENNLPYSLFNHS